MYKVQDKGPMVGLYVRYGAYLFSFCLWLRSGLKSGPGQALPFGYVVLLFTRSRCLYIARLGHFMAPWGMRHDPGSKC